MAKKYYAVKNGRKTGIFHTWDECKKQVHGYPNAKYKSFPTLSEANDYLAKPKKKKKKVKGKDRAVAYVDGSYDASTGWFSSSAILLFNGKEIHLAKSSNDQTISYMRNVAGEIKAAQMAMQYCVDRGIRSLRLYHDYTGIASWCTGEWQAKQVGTKEYKRFYNSIRNRLDVEFVKVKGHSGDLYNELADQLAKSALGL